MQEAIFAGQAVSALYPFLRRVVKSVKPDNPLKGLIASGNLKIPKSTAIFNMSSATECASLKLGICSAVIDGKNFCYAMKSERSYRPNVKPYRDRQRDYWLKVSAEEFVWHFMLIQSLKPEPYTKIRLNEAGDFHSQECVDKAERIAQLLHPYDVKVYCYTSRKDLDFSKRRTNFLVVNGSGFSKAGVQNEFSIVPKEVGNDPKQWPKGYAKCPMDCTVCDRCSKPNKKTFVTQH